MLWEVAGSIFSCARNEHLSKEVKIAESMYLPTLLYGCESLVCQKKHKNELNVVEMESQNKER